MKMRPDTQPFWLCSRVLQYNPVQLRPCGLAKTAVCLGGVGV